MQVSGTSEQVVGAVRMITEKLRAVLGLGGAAGGGDRDRGGGMERQQPPWGDNKRQRGPEPDDRRRGAPGRMHVVAVARTATSRYVSATCITYLSLLECQPHCVLCMATFRCAFAGLLGIWEIHASHGSDCIKHTSCAT
jgi:hypothetical protein